MSLGRIAIIVAGVVTTGIGVVVACFLHENKVKKAEKRGEGRGAAKEKAQNEEVHQRANERYEDISSKLAEMNAMVDLILALASVGYSCAASNGQVTVEAKLMIDEFIMGVSKDTLPSHVKAQMGGMALDPPDIRTAHAHAAMTATPATWDLFDEIVNLVTRIDEAIPEEKQIFVSKWYNLRAAA